MYNVCLVCGVVLDRFDDQEFVCNDIRCQRTFGDRVDAHEDRKNQRYNDELPERNYYEGNSPDF